MRGLNPFRALRPLPNLTPSHLSQKNGFLAVKAYKMRVTVEFTWCLVAFF